MFATLLLRHSQRMDPKTRKARSHARPLGGAGRARLCWAPEDAERGGDWTERRLSDLSLRRQSRTRITCERNSISPLAQSVLRTHLCAANEQASACPPFANPVGTHGP